MHITVNNGRSAYLRLSAENGGDRSELLRDS